MYHILTEAIVTALVLSIIPMLAISCGAGLVAMAQAITQIQEQSFTHLARLVVMACVLIWGGSHAFTTIEDLFVKVVSLAAVNNSN